MEEDDDFGDLYSDVLLPFQSPTPAAAQSKPQLDRHLNSDDEEILYGAPNPNPNPNSNLSSSQPLPTVSIKPVSPPIKPDSDNGSGIRLNLNLIVKQEDQKVKIDRDEYAVDDPNPNFELPISEPLPRVSVQPESSSLKSDLALGSGIRWNLNLNVKQEDQVGDSCVVKQKSVVEDREDFNKFDIEEIGDMGTDPLIPGLSNPPNPEMRDENGDDWDSDSEDDLQIVLDDDKNIGLMGMNPDDEDENGDPLMILVSGEPGHLPMEERDWGEDVVQGDGDRKDGGEGVKAGMKIGFNNQAYHQFHSQFKYVRPGAAPISGGAPVGPGGALGQVRPPVGPIAGRGRGEWRPSGMKGFHSGFAWGCNASGRGFGVGLDFTLPSHKTIFEVDIDSFEEKPWKLAGIDVSDFFNFAMTEESWKDYCKQLELHRMGTSMHGKIRVYESGRAEQDYDPDLPPELAAATGIIDNSSENANAGKIEAPQSGVLAKEFGNIQPPLPTGRSIQVETGSGERLPSMDTRPPRLRDSDAIIEIVLEGLENDDPLPEDEAIELPEHDLSKEGSGGGHQSEVNFVVESNGRIDVVPPHYNSSKKDDITEGDEKKPLLQEAQTPNSRERSSSYADKDVDAIHEERRTKSRMRDRSPDITCSRSTLEKRKPDSQKEGSVESVGGKRKEGSVESVGGKRSLHVSSPISGGSDEELDVENEDDSHDDLSRVRKERDLATTSPAEDFVDENPLVSSKRKRGSSRVQQSSPRDFDDREGSRAPKSSENRKTRSGSERDYPKAHGIVEEEVIRHGRPKIPVSMKRSYDYDEHPVNPRYYDERHDKGKHRLVESSREDPYSYRDWDPHGRKERDNPRKRALVEEMGSRHRNKVYESERMNKDEYFKFKHMDNGSSRAYHDKDMGSQYRGRDDNTKNRYDTIDDSYRKRRNEDEYMRRDAEKEEVYLGHREYTSHRKRERDNAMDSRKREGQVRSRDEGHHSARYKEEEWFIRERERHRPKQSHEESFPKRERDEGRDGVEGARTIEDKGWVGKTRVKDKDLERDYQFKDLGRQSEHHKRRENRVEDATLLHHKGSEEGYVRGDQLVSDERRSKLDRGSTRTDIEDSRTHHKRHKESSRKGNESEGGEQYSMISSKRNQEDRNGQVKELVMGKGTIERGKGDNDISKKQKEEATASSDEEREDSRRGRSKLERWTSNKDLDLPITPKKSSPSLSKVKETERYNYNIDPALSTKIPDENHPHSSDPKEEGDSENINSDPKNDDNNNNKHLDTFEKLKKRSERFKLPMPSDKEAMVIKKMENEPLPLTQDEAPPALEIKPERPARKRRWISG